MSANQKAEIVRLAEQKKFTKAKKICTKLCKQAPNDAEAWFLLGSINGGMEDFPAAEFCCKKALKLAPKNPILLFNLGIALLKQGKADQAIEKFKITIELQPQHAESYLEIANAYNLVGESTEAITNYTTALQLNSSLIYAHNNLADTYRDLNRLPDAIKHYEQAIAIQKDFVEPYCGMASTFLVMFHYDKTIELLETNIPHLSSTACLHFCLAVAYQNQGDIIKAGTNYKKTLKADPEHIDARTGLATLSALQGDYTKAGEILEVLINKHPNNTAATIAYVTYASHFDKTEKAIKLGEDFLAKKTSTDSTRSKLMFALAKLFEKQKKLDIAFKHYQQGNILRGDSFNEKSHIKMFESFVNTYSKNLFTKSQHTDRTNISPIFIVGMPRSGTSLAEQILASHPAVFGAGELPTINRIIKDLPQRLSSSKRYPECLDKLDTNTLDEIAIEYISEASESSNGETFITDKMPLNAIHLGFIALLFPDARIIHCTRDPRDTCLSCYFTNFAGEHAYAYSLSSLGKFHRMYEKQMKHWEEVVPNKIFELSYEALVESPEQVIRQLVDFCGLQWTDECLNFHQTKRTVATASHNQVRQKMYSSSVEKWRLYEDHLGELFAALDSTI